MAVSGKLRDLRLCAFATDTRWEVAMASVVKRPEEFSVVVVVLFSELATRTSLGEEDLSRLFVPMTTGDCCWLVSQSWRKAWFKWAGAASDPVAVAECSFWTDGFRLNLRHIFSGDCGALKDSNELILCFIDDPLGETRDKLDCSSFLEVLSRSGGLRSVCVFRSEFAFLNPFRLWRNQAGLGATGGP